MIAYPLDNEKHTLIYLWDKGCDFYRQKEIINKILIIDYYKNTRFYNYNIYSEQGKYILWKYPILKTPQLLLIDSNGNLLKTMNTRWTPKNFYTWIKEALDLSKGDPEKCRICGEIGEQTVSEYCSCHIHPPCQSCVDAPMECVNCENTWQY